MKSEFEMFFKCVRKFKPGDFIYFWQQIMWTLVFITEPQLDLMNVQKFNPNFKLTLGSISSMGDIASHELLPIFCHSLPSSVTVSASRELTTQHTECDKREQVAINSYDRFRSIRRVAVKVKLLFCPWSNNMDRCSTGYQPKTSIFTSPLAAILWHRESLAKVSSRDK